MTARDPRQPGRAKAQIVDGGTDDRPGRDVMAATTLGGYKVFSADGKLIGKISDIMLDVRSGRVAYAVLSEGGFLGIGDTLHVIPWVALTIDIGAKCFRLDIAAQRIRDDPGFDKGNWSLMADTTWCTQLHASYNRRPYWTRPEDLPQLATSGEQNGSGANG